jgi:integrase
MKARQHQNGHVYLHGKTWYLRYRVPEIQADGCVKNMQKCQKLVECRGQYRSKRAVQPLALEFLAPYNTNSASLLSGVTLNHWMTKHYLPMIKSGGADSTYPDYYNKWNRYVRPHGDVPLREFRTSVGQEMLRTISVEHDLSSTTLKHVKSLLSGAFSEALRQDVLGGSNPMRHVRIPKARGPKDTYAYSLQEILAMLKVLDGMAAAVVAVASFTGLRDSELRGLRWEDYNGKEIFVLRAVWRGRVKPPKTKASKAPVAVIEILAGYLDALWRSQGRPDTGFVFASEKGTPQDLQMFAQRVIRPALTDAGLTWHAYHACRRGLATNLHQLGISDVVIQRILRHSNASVTRNCYIKTADVDAVKAMEKLQCATAVQQWASSQQSDVVKKSADAAEVSENTQVVGTGGEGGFEPPIQLLTV